MNDSVNQSLTCDYVFMRDEKYCVGIRFTLLSNVVSSAGVFVLNYITMSGAAPTIVSMYLYPQSWIHLIAMVSPCVVIWWELIRAKSNCFPGLQTPPIPAGSRWKCFLLRRRWKLQLLIELPTVH